MKWYKNKTFNVECIVKWIIMIDKIDFWAVKSYIF